MMKINNNRKNYFQVTQIKLHIKALRYLFIFVIFTSFAFVGNAQNTNSKLDNKKLVNWVGEYELDTLELIPKQKKNEMVPAATYTLTISKAKDADKLGCKFLASGVQLYDEFNCSINPFGKKLKVYFEDDLTGKDSEYIDYKKAQLLFTLQPSTRYRNKILFIPETYKITYFGSKGKRIYFEKSAI